MKQLSISNFLFCLLLLTVFSSTYLLRIRNKSLLFTSLKTKQYEGTPIIRLDMSQMALSPNGMYKLTLQSDGNLVLASVANTNQPTTDKVLFASGTFVQPNNPNLPFYAIMQTDGNFVVYNKTNFPLWASGSFGQGKAPYNLILQNNGNLAIYDSNGQTIWATNTVQFSGAVTKLSGQTNTVLSGNGMYRLTMQSDGNLVLYSVALLNNLNNDVPIWASNTMAQSSGNSLPYYAIMQTDGNFVVYDRNNIPKWASGSNGRGQAPYYLTMQDDGNLVIYDGTLTPIWATGTFQTVSNSTGNPSATSGQTCPAGFGYAGKCLGDSSSALLSNVPFSAYASKMTNYFLTPLQKIMASPDICWGDFTGDILSNGNDDSLNNVGCGSIPIDPSSTLSVVGLNVYNVPCGSPQQVQTCIAFDKCGTVYISLNGGIIQCVATLVSSGVASIVSPFAGILNQMAVGFSTQRKFQQTLDIAVRSGSSNINVVRITTQAHFALNIQLQIPLDYQIGKFNLGDLINFNISGTLFLDFGPSAQLVQNMINILVNPNKSSFKNDLSSIMKSAGEISAVISGTFTLNLSNLSTGFLSDINFNVAECNFLITTGGPNTASQQPAGLYVYITGQGLNNFGDLVNQVTSHFASTLKDLGINLPTTSNTSGSSIALFIDQEFAGFQILLGNYKMVCFYQYSSSSGSCNFGKNFFTAISKEYGFVIQEASQFFDQTGKQVSQMDQLAENKLSQAASTVQNDVKVVAQATAAEAAKIANNIQQNFSNFEKQISNTAQQAVNVIENDVQTVINDIENVL